MAKPLFNYYSLICSRDTNHSKTSLSLFDYFTGFGAQVINLIGKKSIFEAYTEGFNSVKPNDYDIFILCHDDIKIVDSYPQLEFNLSRCRKRNTGFVGVAGTRLLQANGVWWDWNNPHNMRGKVRHGNWEKNTETYFGPSGQVVVCDGVFLACRAEVLKDINLTKPETFVGDWDFYDIYYTLQAHMLGYKNYVDTNLSIIHESAGNPRETWHQNREALLRMYKLPVNV